MGLFTRVMPTIAVDDLDRATRFYRDKLGLKVERLEDEDMGSALVEIGSDRLLLYKSSYRRGETTAVSFQVDDVDRAVRELRDKGVTFEEYDFPGLKTIGGVATLNDMKTSWFKDSEGNTLAITDAREETLRKAA